MSVVFPGRSGAEKDKPLSKLVIRVITKLEINQKHCL